MTPSERLEFHQRIASSERKQALAWLRWKGDVKLFIRECAWSFDPRRQDLPEFPLVPWPKQAELLDWMTERYEAQEEGLIDKSRDTGVSWFTIYFASHRWIFFERFQATWGALKEENVDKLGDPDTLLEKARMFLRWLPRWLLPAGFDFEHHAQFKKIINPETGSILKGATGKELGRSGRASMVFLDEAAFLEHPERVEAALRYVSPCRIYVSTANPGAIGGPFYRKLKSGKVKVFTIRWSDDPTKDEAWYQNELDSGDETIVRQELDSSWEEGGEFNVFPMKYIQAAVKIELTASGPLMAGLDVAAFGASSNVLCLRRGPVVQPMLTWRGISTKKTANKVLQECRDRGVQQLCYDCQGVGEGVRGELEDGGQTPFDLRPISFGAAPSFRFYDGKAAEERFANLRAELYWGILRQKFRKTYERLEGIKEHPEEECISLPNDPKLIQELAGLHYDPRDTGKIQIESKKKMRSRGVASPDRADALALCFFGAARSQAFEDADVDFGPESAAHRGPWS